MIKPVRSIAINYEDGTSEVVVQPGMTHRTHNNHVMNGPNMVREYLVHELVWFETIQEVLPPERVKELDREDMAKAVQP